MKRYKTHWAEEFNRLGLKIYGRKTVRCPLCECKYFVEYKEGTTFVCGSCGIEFTFNEKQLRKKYEEMKGDKKWGTFYI